MLSLRPRLIGLALLVLCSFAAPPSTEAADAKPGLFVSLTTDDVWAASMAITFAHQRALKSGHDPVVLWMNVRAVYLADKDAASSVPGPMRAENQTIQDMLRSFIADGGKVVMCGGCSAAAGLSLEDYIDGVVMGEWPEVEGYLFDPNIKTLSW